MMSTPAPEPESTIHYYARERTAELLASTRPRVYLYGSYEGYNNFGDILQLKNTIRLHRQAGRFEPIMMVALESLIDADYPAALERWFEVEHVLYTSRESMDASAMGLVTLEEIARGGVMHLYGGGHLNSMWGRRHVDIASDLLIRVGVERYLMSGLQLDADFMPALEELFAIREPDLIGLRDHPSVELVRASSMADRARFSFDDTAELMIDWTTAVRADGVGAGSFGLHLNTTTQYTARRDQHDHVRELLDLVREQHPDSDLVALHAYDDVREVVRDTLPSLKAFDAFLPFDAYGVVDIAKMALELRTGVTPGLGRFPLEFGIVSSYHTALFLSMLGVPAYLASLNDYYRQKAAIFGRTVSEREFVTEPRRHWRDFAPELRARADWMEEAVAAMSEWNTELGGPTSLRRRSHTAEPAADTAPLFVFTGRR